MTTIKSILEELLGHDDGVEIGSGYHNECKQEIDQALQQIEQLIEEKRPNFDQVDPYNRSFLEAMFNGFYDDLKKVIR